MVPRIATNVPGLADALEKWAKALDWLSGIRGVHPVVVDRSASGPVVSLAAPLTRAVKLTTAAATSGSYNAAEVYPTAGGAWALATGGWTGVVWEYNRYSNVSLPAYVTVEWCGAAGEWRFQLGGCT